MSNYGAVMKGLAICRQDLMMVIGVDYGNYDRSCLGYCCCFGVRIVFGREAIVICIVVIWVSDDRYFLKDSRI